MCQQENPPECQAANVSDRFYLARAPGTISRDCSEEVETILKPVETQHGISVFPLSCVMEMLRESGKGVLKSQRTMS
jgi:hypothetical protein